MSQQLDERESGGIADAGSERSGGLVRFAGWCYDRRRLVLLLWVIAIVGFSIAGQAAGGALQKTFDLPGSDAAKAFHILGQDFDRPGDTGQLVWKVKSGASPTSPEVLAVVQPVLDQLAEQPHVAAVATPFDGNPADQRFISTTQSTGSPDPPSASAPSCPRVIATTPQ